MTKKPTSIRFKSYMDKYDFVNDAVFSFTEEKDSVRNLLNDFHDFVNIAETYSNIKLQYTIADCLPDECAAFNLGESFRLSFRIFIVEDEDAPPDFELYEVLLSRYGASDDEVIVNMVEIFPHTLPHTPEELDPKLSNVFFMFESLCELLSKNEYLDISEDGNIRVGKL